MKNVWKYVAIAYVFSIAGGLVMGSGVSAGGLLFIAGPIVGAIVLRKYSGEGWKTAGLGLRASKGIYLIGLFALLITSLLELAIGKSVGAITFGASTTVSVGITAFLTLLPSRLIFAFCEEFGWRGYLTPKLNELGFGRLRNHLLTGTIWATWHTPLILATSDYTVLQPAVFIPLFYFGVLATAVLLGEMRLRCNSIWPGVIAHGTASALGYALIAKNFMTLRHPVIFSIGPASILSIIIVGLFATTLFAVRTPQTKDSSSVRL